MKDRPKLIKQLSLGIFSHPSAKYEGLNIHFDGDIDPNRPKLQLQKFARSARWRSFVTIVDRDVKAICFNGYIVLQVACAFLLQILYNGS